MLRASVRKQICGKFPHSGTLPDTNAGPTKRPHPRTPACAKPGSPLLTNSTISGCLTNKFAANGTAIDPPATNQTDSGMFSLFLGRPDRQVKFSKYLPLVGTSSVRL